jgi:polysaccharide pyruvyl transferase WcaK-like protein
VFTLRPADTLLRHDVDHAVRTLGLSREELLEEVRRFDVLLLGGGGILFDYWVKEHLREALLAEEAGVPVVVYAVGAGPLDEPASVEAVRQCLEAAAVVTVRDVRAQRTLEKIGVTREIRVTADAAMLLDAEELPPDALAREGLEQQQTIVAMSVREPGPAAPGIDIEHYQVQLASAADYMVDRFGARIVFAPMEPERHDVQQSHAVISKMYRATAASVLSSGYTSGQMLSMIGHFSFVVGMRLHFLIFAALREVPFVALPYAPKVTGFIEELGMETPPGEGLTIGRLLAYIDRMWDRQDELRKLLQREVPVLQERARETARLAVEVIGQEPAGDTEGGHDAEPGAAPGRNEAVPAAADR